MNQEPRSAAQVSRKSLADLLTTRLYMQSQSVRQVEFYFVKKYSIKKHKATVLIHVNQPGNRKVIRQSSSLRSPEVVAICLCRCKIEHLVNTTKLNV